jgi:mono/diheme cytochrome c family protein
MKHMAGIALGFSLLMGAIAVGASLAAGEPKAASPQPQGSPSPKTAQLSASNRGQQVFEQNCSRCHNAPQGFSSHISGSIATHMRVRAGISEADYKALLRFLNH